MLARLKRYAVITFAVVTAPVWLPLLIVLLFVVLIALFILCAALERLDRRSQAKRYFMD